MALTQAQIALQLVAQLRALDPSASAEVGTPERKILDTVAEAITAAQLDLNILGGALDITSKYGSDLDSFTSLFGFGRQTGSFATGYVALGRPTVAPYDIAIPVGTQVQGASTTTVNNTPTSTTVTFATTTQGTLLAGQTSVIVPIQATLAGSSGNVAAGAITQFANVGSPVLGVTTVTNALPTSNGTDQESDSELKVRFQNTIFRNLAGTADQYMALAVATQFSTKAVVLGPISRYQEYVQVPSYDDAGFDPSGNFHAGQNTGGVRGQWTTASSNNPYAKFIFGLTPAFLSTNSANQVFYNQGTQYRFNAFPLDFGDTFREGGIVSTTQPNVLFLQVYTGTDPTVVAPRPGDVTLLEYSYTSSESRNDVSHNLTNCVDVYVNGSNDTTADTVLPPVSYQFSSTTTSPYYTANFIRFGQPGVFPIAGHYYSTLFWQPVVALPSTIVVGTSTYLLDQHYFCVQDTTLNGNTVRARNGIEWDPTINGLLSGDMAATVWATGENWTLHQVVYDNGAYYQADTVLTDNITAPHLDGATHWAPIADPYTGATIIASTATSIPVNGYTYDQNIVDLQASLEGAKQITTDVLAHACTTRYFKFDFTIVYSPGQTPSTINGVIQSNLATFLTNRSFGATVQLTDLLVTVRNTNGVQNARWSYDDNTADPRVTECDVNGNPLSGPVTFETDFYLRDNQLPSLPINALATDSVAGLILRPRAQNTFSVP